MSELAIILVLLSAGIHALWNLLAHHQKIDSSLFLRSNLVACLAVLPLELFADWQGDYFPGTVWGLLALTGLSHAFYYIGLVMGYRSGNFSVVYPIARALPILFLALFDIVRGEMPDLLGWLGIVLVSMGCFLAPLQSWGKFEIGDYWNQTTFWIFTIVFATVGYTCVDKIAVGFFPSNGFEAARYDLLGAWFAVVFLGLGLKLFGETTDNSEVEESKETLGFVASWKWPLAYAIFVFGSYWLMVWAYQLSAYTSYLVGLRQVSIFFGVIFALLFLEESVSWLRFGAVGAIVLGAIFITQAT